MAAHGLKEHMLWSEAAADPSIASLQHPILDTAFDKQTYYENFGAVLDELDGSTESDYVDFFFTRAPTEPSKLVFVDDDAQQDFADWAEETGCLDRTGAKMGETDEEKERREAAAVQKKAAEAQKAKARAEQEARKAAAEADPALKAARDIFSRSVALEKAHAKAAKAKGAKAEKEAAKVAKAEAALKEMVAAFMESYGDRKELLPEAFGGEGLADPKKSNTATKTKAKAKAASSSSSSSSSSRSGAGDKAEASSKDGSAAAAAGSAATPGETAATEDA